MPEEPIPVLPEQLIRDAEAIRMRQDVAVQIYERSAELAELETRRAQLDRELASVNDDIGRLKRRTLPDLFDRVHVDRLGVPGWNADVVLSVKYHASIGQDMEEVERDQAWGELDRLGGSDLCKHTVSVEFTRAEAELAADFLQFIRGWNRMAGRVARVKREVHWSTLTKFVREQSQRQPPVKMNLTALGATVTRECNIVWRKSK